jgi:hypothetical protein
MWPKLEDQSKQGTSVMLAASKFCFSSMEEVAVCFPETLVVFEQTARICIQEDSSLHFSVIF